MQVSVLKIETTQVVVVERGCLALFGNHQMAHRMLIEIGAFCAGMAETTGLKPVGAGEICLSKVGVAESGLGKVSISQISPPKASAPEGNVHS